MKLPRRQFLHLAAGAAALPAATRLATALDYPTRPVHLLEGFGAGSAPDIVARLIGQALYCSKKLHPT
jgi:tripartite-type tricarboxylate transporter receptor subunit TctC